MIFGNPVLLPICHHCVLFMELDCYDIAYTLTVLCLLNKCFN